MTDRLHECCVTNWWTKLTCCWLVKGVRLKSTLEAALFTSCLEVDGGSSDVVGRVFASSARTSEARAIGICSRWFETVARSFVRWCNWASWPLWTWLEPESCRAFEVFGRLLLLFFPRVDGFLFFPCTLEELLGLSPAGCCVRVAVFIHVESSIFKLPSPWQYSSHSANVPEKQRRYSLLRRINGVSYLWREAFLDHVDVDHLYGWINIRHLFSF